MTQEQEGAMVEKGEPNDSAVAVVAENAADVNKKEKRFFSRLWNGLFRVRGDDFEKRLQYISREEATVLSRMKRRSITWRTHKKSNRFVCHIRDSMILMETSERPS